MRRDKIILSLVNRERYQDLLENVPNRDFENLSVLYYEYLEEEGAAQLVTNSDMEEMGLNEEVLYELAYENTKTILPLKVASLSSIVTELDPSREVEAENATEMYVLGNEKGVLGAAAILYPEALEKVAEVFGENYMLLPSSKHEFIALAKDETTNVDDLQNMVREINFIQVWPEDRLSDQVYEYDGVSGQVKQVTFGPESSLHYGSFALEIETDEDMEDTLTDAEEDVEEIPEQNQM